MKLINRLVVVCAAFLSLSVQGQAAEHTIEMLNYSDDGGMVFQPDFLKVEPGDTVHFVATHSSHFTRSYLVPQGAAQWNSELDKDFSVTLDVPGTYVYYCPPHLMMAMLGVIQVGDKIDDATIEKARTKLGPKLVMNAERLENAFANLEVAE